MANIYVRNAGSNTSPYDTWAKAAPVLATVVTAATASDTIWVADDHAESAASSQTFTCPATPGLRVLCANTHTTAPPTGLATSATVTATNSNTTMIISRCAYFYGINFVLPPSSGTTPILHLGVNTGNSLIFERCNFKIPAGTSATFFVGGGFTGTTNTNWLVFLSCGFR